MLEENVPLSERFLTIKGVVSPETFVKVRKGLQSEISSNTLCLFISFSYADIPLGKSFDVLFKIDNPVIAVESKCIIRAVTQQFSEPINKIPYGWKTICLLEFQDRIPDFVQILPTIDDWYSSKRYQHLGLTNTETWKLLA